MKSIAKPFLWGGLVAILAVVIVILLAQGEAISSLELYLKWKGETPDYSNLPNLSVDI